MNETTETPWLLFLMGPNGAGKSTFYETYLKDDPLFKKVPFLNTDIEATQLSGEASPDISSLLQAGKNIRHRLIENIDQKKSFIYELTGAGKTHLFLMDTAKERGFQIATIFIGLSRVELSHLRVQKRTQEGGHTVSGKDIERRFPRIMENLPDMIRKSDLSAVFDNSSKKPFELLCMTCDEKSYMISNHDWLKKALEGEDMPPQMNLYQNLKNEKKEKITQWLDARFKNFFQNER